MPAHRHPELKEHTVAEVFEDDKLAVLPLPKATFYNKYSVAARALGRPVEIHADPGRIVIHVHDQRCLSAKNNSLQTKYYIGL